MWTFWPSANPFARTGNAACKKVWIPAKGQVCQAELSAFRIKQLFQKHSMVQKCAKGTLWEFQAGKRTTLSYRKRGHKLWQPDVPQANDISCGCCGISSISRSSSKPLVHACNKDAETSKGLWRNAGSLVLGHTLLKMHEPFMGRFHDVDTKDFLNEQPTVQQSKDYTETASRGVYSG